MYNDDFGWVLIGDGVLIGAPELKPGKLHETKPAFACFRQETPWNSPMGLLQLRTSLWAIRIKS